MSDDENTSRSADKERRIPVPDLVLARAKLLAQMRANRARQRAGEVPEHMSDQSARPPVAGADDEHVRRVDVQTLLVSARELAGALEDFEVTADQELRTALLAYGAAAAAEGIQAVAGHMLVQAPQAFLTDLERAAERDAAAAMRALAFDGLSLKLFLATESRLLVDVGFPPNSVEPVRSAMAETIIDGPALAETAASVSAAEAVDGLAAIAEQVRDRVHHRPTWRRLKGVLVGLGGATICVSDQLVGAALAPVTAGISVYGSVLSQMVGGGVFWEGLQQARGVN